MRVETLGHLRCLSCRGELELGAHEAPVSGDVAWGEVKCTSCSSSYPILAGVLLYVSDVETVLIRHIKGIGQLVPDERIPQAHREVYFEARESLAEEGFFDEGFEEDLEAERVNALYVMNHYLAASQVPHAGNSVIDTLVREHWDHGPLQKTAAWIRARGARSVVELGASVGGLAQGLGLSGSGVETYLGIDASFASVALARHLALGATYPRKIRIPGDLIQGPVSIEPALPAPAWKDRPGADLIFGDLVELAVCPGAFEVSVALGVIDMLEDPSVLPLRQREMIREDGAAIQASPYIWHEPVAQALREHLHEKLGEVNSASAIQTLYRERGFIPGESLDAMPWVFFKHLRQLELYSVHWSVHHPAHKCEP